MVDGDEGLSLVNESHGNICLFFPTFGLNFSGCIDHVRGSSIFPEAILAFM